MPSENKRQQRFFQLVRAVQKGDVKKSEVTKDVKEAAKETTAKTAREFAKKVK